MIKHPWFPDRVDALRRYADQKLSASLIADAMNAEFGSSYTRNSIISKAHVLNVQICGHFRKHHQPLMKHLLRPIPSEDANSEPVSMLSLTTRSCRFEVSGETDPSLYKFCGGNATPGMPYCPHHMRIAYVPPKVFRGKKPSYRNQ